MTPTIPDEAVQAMPERIYASAPSSKGCVVSFDIPSLAYDIEYVSADLAAPFLQGLKVKALEWGESRGRWFHKSMAPRYEVIGGAIGDFVLQYNCQDLSRHPTVEAAKAAAQADYEARIRSAIEVSAPDIVNPITDKTFKRRIADALEGVWGALDCSVEEIENVIAQLKSDGLDIIETGITVSEPSPRAQALEEAAQVADAIVLAVDALLAARKRLASIDPEWEQGHLFPIAIEALNSAPAAIRALSSQEPVLAQALEVTDGMLNAGQEHLCQLSASTSFNDYEQAEIYKAMRGVDPSFVALRNALQLAKDMFKANDIDLPNTIAVIDAALTSQPVAYHIADAGKMVADGWLPIETAPKDGTEFLAWPCNTENGVIVVKSYWYVHPSIQAWITDEIDCGDFDFSPTHWHPLPASPEVSG